MAIVIAIAAAACGPNPHRGIPNGWPWLQFYGAASNGGDLKTLAATFRVVLIDVDPLWPGYWGDDDIAAVRANGVNRILGYLDVGGCETYRTWWSNVPAGFVSCSANTAAQLGSMTGYPDEMGMDLSNSDYQKLIVDYAAPLLAARGIDGFFLDNYEIVEHVIGGSETPCDSACAQGGLDLVRKLREKFPDMLLVINQATGDVTRLGTTGGVAFPSLIDGVNQEGVYLPTLMPQIEAQLLAWQSMQLKPGAQPFWIATLDYVASCSDLATALPVLQRSRSNGFAPCVSESANDAVCYWPQN